jgi:hypothetical protein
MLNEIIELPLLVVRQLLFSLANGHAWSKRLTETLWHTSFTYKVLVVGMECIIIYALCDGRVPRCTSFDA